MMFINKKISHFLIATGALFSMLVQVNAAEIQELAPPPYEVTDPASVNVATGQLSPSLTDVSIGGEMGLAHTLSSYTSNFVNWEGGPLGFTDNYNGTIYHTLIYRPSQFTEDGAVYALRVSDGASTVDFRMLGNGQYEPFSDPRYELKWVPGTGYLFIKPDGTEVRYSTGPGISNTLPPSEMNNRYAMSQIKYPNGLTIDIKSAGYSTNSRYSVKTNTGYQLKFVYEIHNRPIDPAKDVNGQFIPGAYSSAWSSEMPRYIYAINNNHVYCPHSSASCSIPSGWPRATHTWPDGMPKAMYVGDSEFSVTNALGETTRYKHRAIDIALNSNGNPIPNYYPPNTHFRPRIVRIEHPDGAAYQYTYRNMGFTTGPAPFVGMSYMPTGDAVLTGATLVGGNSGWGYSLGNAYSPHGQLDTLLNGSGGYQGVNRVIFQTRYNATVEVDTWNKFVQFQQTSPYYWRISSVRDKLGGGSTSYGYDGRSNITSQSTNGITIRAGYPTSCTTSNRKYCNKPEWVADAKGNRTYYTYHAASGQVATITPPADDRGITPKVYITYAQRYAYVKDVNGSRVQVADPIWLKNQEFRCADSQLNGSSCTGTDLIRTTYLYNHDNLHMTGMEVYSQKDVKTLRTCYQYDIYGNQIGVTEPNANPTSCNNTHSAGPYTHATRYDLLGRVTGTIKPDPDGNGPLGFAATRNVFNNKGQLVRVESGELFQWQNENVKPNDWLGFTILGKSVTTYDSIGRKATQQAQDAVGNIFKLTQFSYSKADQVSCKAVRMNRDAYNNLPASACTLGAQGIYGPDRITRYEYTTYKEQLEREYRAVGTSLEQLYRRNHYDEYGRLTGLTDANGNYTELKYNDNFRLWKRIYPSKANGSSLNQNDYNEYTYDLNGNITLERKRNTATISYGYDNLNRMTLKDRSGSTNDVTYTYDLRGLQKTALFRSSGQGITNDFDGFGNTKTSTNTMGGNSRTLSYLPDNNGNRLRVTHPDGNYFAYTFDGLNRVNSLSENTTNLMNILYRRDGARDRLLRPGSASTGYDFDEIGRLKNFTQDFTGTADDLANTFTYNPASQVVNLRVGNDLYHYRGNTNRAGSYVPNGLNQYTSVGGISLGYDNNGNLTNDGTPTTYSYDEENRLLGTTSPSSTFQYDPLGRLFSATLGGVTTQFLYDGDSLVAEYVNNSLTRRYAHGDRVDEPWVQYEGTAVNSTTRRFLHADHQGSVVALSDSVGTAKNKLSYDVYGIPHNNNAGRFGYTGQLWMKEVGLFYYKARFYHPKLGRFLQTDPIFYQDQMNLYGYVHNDPVNMVDPGGRSSINVHFKDQPIHYSFAGKTRTIPQSLSRGHSGVVIIDDKTGHTRYREFGRYDGTSGKVRGVTISNLTLDKQGVPTAQSLSKVFGELKSIGAKAGSTDIGITYQVGGDSEKMMQEANTWSDKNWALPSSTCHGFADSVVDAGGGDGATTEGSLGADNSALTGNIRNSYSDNGMSGSVVKICSGMGAQKDGCN